uniref:Uncharacterized protein n=1 Tax=Poecilia formosa TaxID=48698 RepID=A0A087XHZ4_POEFO
MDSQCQKLSVKSGSTWSPGTRQRARSQSQMSSEIRRGEVKPRASLNTNLSQQQ